MSVLEAALSVFESVNMHDLRTKSIGLSELFLELTGSNKDLGELTLVSPRESNKRGSQLAFAHPQAFSICQALIDRGIITDFRAPDILRIGFAPLYISYRDVWDTVHSLAEIMANKIYRLEKYSRTQKVT
jgi:kynureninase